MVGSGSAGVGSGVGILIGNSTSISELGKEKKEVCCMYVRLLKGNEVALSWAPPNLGNLTAYSAGSVCLRKKNNKRLPQG